METTEALSKKTAHLIDQMLAGNKRALSKLVTIVENDGEESHQVLRHITPPGKAHRVGVTGPPGAGKSTLVNRLTAYARREELRVGIIAADPSSPFSRGAVLGDRVRMTQHYMDDGVHIRSMSTRGSLGGLPTTVHGVIKLMDVAGMDLILVETVGVGQMELDIMENVDTVIVALVPEAGDDVQAMKAGLMEIADVFVVNKADRPGADSMAVEIGNMLMLSSQDDSWEIPVLATQAENDIGVEELYKQVWRHREAGVASGMMEARRARQRRNELTAVLQKMVVQEFMDAVSSDPRVSDYVSQMNDGELTLYEAAEKIYDAIFAAGGVNPELSRR